MTSCLLRSTCFSVLPLALTSTFPSCSAAILVARPQGGGALRRLETATSFPLKARIRARSLDEFGGWVKHEGEEFLIVVSGEVRLFTKYYEPATLMPGDSVYLDSQMGHACVSIGSDDAQVIWVCTQVVLDV
jgi:mannose-6-phosphate isomerase-like protein (cupin superfamily)